MNGDLISREATRNVLKERYCEGCTYYGVKCKSVLSGNCPIYNAIIAVDAVPAVDAEPVRHGRWIDLREGSKDVPKCKCSECGYVRIGLETNYCPICGAKMDAGDTP